MERRLHPPLFVSSRLVCAKCHQALRYSMAPRQVAHALELIQISVIRAPRHVRLPICRSSERVCRPVPATIGEHLENTRRRPRLQSNEGPGQRTAQPGPSSFAGVPYLRCFSARGARLGVGTSL